MTERCKEKHHLNGKQCLLDAGHYPGTGHRDEVIDRSHFREIERARMDGVRLPNYRHHVWCGLDMDHIGICLSPYQMHDCPDVFCKKGSRHAGTCEYYPPIPKRSGPTKQYYSTQTNFTDITRALLGLSEPGTPSPALPTNPDLTHKPVEYRWSVSTSRPPSLLERGRAIHGVMDTLLRNPKTSGDAMDALSYAFTSSPAIDLGIAKMDFTVIEKRLLDWAKNHTTPITQTWLKGAFDQGYVPTYKSCPALGAPYGVHTTCGRMWPSYGNKESRISNFMDLLPVEKSKTGEKTVNLTDVATTVSKTTPNRLALRVLRFRDLNKEFGKAIPPAKAFRDLVKFSQSVLQAWAMDGLKSAQTDAPLAIEILKIHNSKSLSLLKAEWPRIESIAAGIIAEWAQPAVKAAVEPKMGTCKTGFTPHPLGPACTNWREV